MPALLRQLVRQLHAERGFPQRADGPQDIKPFIKSPVQGFVQGGKARKQGGPHSPVLYVAFQGLHPPGGGEVPIRRRPVLSPVLQALRQIPRRSVPVRRQALVQVLPLRDRGTAVQPGELLRQGGGPGVPGGILVRHDQHGPRRLPGPQQRRRLLPVSRPVQGAGPEAQLLRAEGVEGSLR